MAETSFNLFARRLIKNLNNGNKLSVKEQSAVDAIKKAQKRLMQDARALQGPNVTVGAGALAIQIDARKADDANNYTMRRAREAVGESPDNVRTKNSRHRDDLNAIADAIRQKERKTTK